MEQFRKGRWDSNLAKNKARDQIAKARHYAFRIYECIEIPSDADGQERDAWVALQNAFRAMAAAMLKTDAAPHVRLGKLEALDDSAKARRNEIADILSSPAAEIAEKLSGFVEKAESVVETAQKIIEDPKKYYLIAENLMNRASAISKKLGFKVTSHMSMEKIDKFLEYMFKEHDLEKKVADVAKGFKTLSKFFGPLQAGLFVAVTVFTTIANAHNWAEVLGKTIASAGVEATVSTVLEGEALEEAVLAGMAAFADAAGITAEVPPVAAALAAAGLVIGATYAAVKVTMFLIDWIFRLDGDSHAMAAAMAAPMAASMSAPMAAEMARH
ncbi:MAG: hypothetical protein AAGH17_02515 [Pseudomonadota bacterium]